MFGSEILDVAIGLILVYLLLSLVASGVAEGIESFIKWRAVNLERGIRAIFDDPEGKGLATLFYNHPLIYSLYQKKYEPLAKRLFGRNLPTYIPARNFAVAVLDMAARQDVPAVYASQQVSGALTIDALQKAANRVASPFVQRALRAAIDSAQGEVTRVQKNLEDWYDSAMDQVSGWYKRRTQWVLFGVGVAVAIGLNVDTITIARYLYSDDAAREAIVARAQKISGDSTILKAGYTQARAALDSLSLPIGWPRRPIVTAGGRPAPPTPWYSPILGWLITSVAVSLGAPFWFDLLNKVMVIRSTVKPKEKSPEEGSEDRQGKGKGGDEADRDEQTRTTAAAVAAAVAGAVAGAGGGAAAGGATPAAQAAQAAAAAAPTPPHTPREWASGEEDGIL